MRFYKNLKSAFRPAFAVNLSIPDNRIRENKICSTG